MADDNTFSDTVESKNLLLIISYWIFVILLGLQFFSSVAGSWAVISTPDAGLAKIIGIIYFPLAIIETAVFVGILLRKKWGFVIAFLAYILHIILFTLFGAPLLLFDPPHGILADLEDAFHLVSIFVVAVTIIAGFLARRVFGQKSPS